MMIFKKFWAGSFLFHIDLKLMKKMLHSTCKNGWELHQQMVEGIEVSSIPIKSNLNKKQFFSFSSNSRTVEQHKIRVLGLEYNLVF